MKRLLFLFALTMGWSCLNLYAQKEGKEAETAQKAQIIKKIVDAKKYMIYADHMYTQRGVNRPINREYTIEIKDSLCISYLPYMGVAHMAPYDGTNILDFEKEMTDYELTQGRKGRLHVSFKVRNGMETLEYSITIYPNGNVNINILPLHRDPITFSGEMALNRKLK